MIAPHSSSSSRRQTSANTARYKALQALALAAMCTLGFADMYSYSMADAFLGQVLAAGGAGSADVMLALVSD